MRRHSWKGIVRGVKVVELLACVLIAGALLTESAAAQSGLGSGRIEGTVMDESGATVAGAMITARNDATGLATVQTSDPSGHFIFPYLTPATYHVSVEKAGFKITQVDSVVVAVGTTISLQPQLAVGSTDTRVVVTADLPLVDTTRSSNGP